MDIVKSGSSEPEIFLLVGLFEDNVGPDRLSDMIATIIKSDIIAYTKRINQELGIKKENYPDYEFNEDGILINPYKRNCEVLYLPVEILHELPIAKYWDDIERVTVENQAIRREINEAIGNTWYKMTTAAKKQYLKDSIFMNPEKCARVVEGFKETSVPDFDPTSDMEYYVLSLLHKWQQSGYTFEKTFNSQPTSYDGAMDIIAIFRDWVEQHRGWDVILNMPTQKGEIHSEIYPPWCGKLCEKQSIGY